MLRRASLLSLLVLACSDPASSPPGADASVADAAQFPDAGPPMDVDVEWTSWPIPPSGPSPSNYLVIDGVVLDTVTGLQWQQVASAAMSWSAATAYCGQRGDGWRLPTLVELSSIVDYGAAVPTIEVAAFPSTPVQDHWTSSSLTHVPDFRWTVHFRAGDTRYYAEADGVASARCVRTHHTVVSGFVGAPIGRYFVDAETVQDTVAGLRWQRTGPATSMTHDAAIAYCADLQLANSGNWRLPTIKELQSLIDVRAFSPAIDDSAFPATSSNAFFSSTPAVFDGARTWTVDFLTGNTLPGDLATPAYVRCVEG